jgi:hypothetical protein
MFDFDNFSWLYLLFSLTTKIVVIARGGFESLADIPLGVLSLTQNV